MICPSCQHENRPSAKFCGKCRTKLQRVCPDCGAEAVPGNAFCDECGAELSPAATMTPPPPSPTLEAQFSSFQQGLPASFRDQLLTHAEGENRLVTVLFADMSRCVQTTADLPPEEMATLISSLLKVMVDVLLKYEGQVDRFLGDGLLAVFGTPRAHESDPERAILAAIEIRESARQLGLEVTAGINTGEVYVGGVGSEQHQEVTVMGPAVNLASRLQGLAEPGQILVGEATYRHTRRAFAFTPLSLEVKGIAQPVTAHAVAHALPRPEKARGIEGLRAELIGRDQELASLTEALAEVWRGRGQMVSLIGEAGLGKSRLVSELKLAALAAPGSRLQAPGGDVAGPPAAVGPGAWSLAPGAAPTPLWLEGRCLELGMSASYWLFVDLFRNYFGFGPEEDDRVRGERLIASLRALVERGDLAEERLEEIGPLLGNLLSIRFGTDWDERLKNAAPEQIRHQTFLAVRDFLVTLARRQPVILICEDLHWADSLSLDLISLLMESLTLSPLFLVCVYRPEREHKCWRLGAIAAQKCAGRYTEISLRELTPPQSRRLVEALLTIENLPASVKDLILEKARGNPFFVEEVVRSLIASGMVYQETGEPHPGREADSSPAARTRGATGIPDWAPGTWRAREGIETVTVPESVQSVILSRVDRLERELRGVLERAAVIGRLFRRRLLEYTTQETTELERALYELEDQALIYQERVVPEEEYSFKHVLTQETIYQSILRRRRTEFHQKVAEAMETLYQDGLDEYCEQLAYHYERSGNDDKAVEYLLQAGEKTRRAYLNEAALSYFQRALERLEGSELDEARKKWRFEALRGSAQSYLGLGRLTEAEVRFQQAITIGHEIGVSASELIRLLFWMGQVLFWQGRHEEEMRIGEEGLALLGEHTETVEAVLMNERLASGHWNRGDREQHRQYNDRNLQLLPRLPYSEELGEAHLDVAFSYRLQKRLEEAWEWLQYVERKAEEHHDLRTLGSVRYHRGVIRLSAGDLRGAILHLERGIELFQKIGNTAYEGQGLGWLNVTFLALGELEKARDHAHRELEIAERMADQGSIPWASRTLGTIALCQGCPETAIEAYQKSFEVTRRFSPTWASQDALLLGRTHLRRGDRREAVRHFEQAATMAGTDGGVLAAALSGLEGTLSDPAAFHAFCTSFREAHPEVSHSALVQWFLDPTAAASRWHRQVCDEFIGSLSADWIWHDSLQDCSFALLNGLEIHAANGRDLWQANLSAPRLSRPISHDFAVQTACVPATEEKPAIGGILLWKDKENYLRLDRGTRGKHEISFQGCLGNQDVVMGRGSLLSERIVLRLERVGGLVTALCSADGHAWFTAGHAEFPVEDPVEVGLYAIGDIDRAIYPGAFPAGAAIRFESFEIWGR